PSSLAQFGWVKNQHLLNEISIRPQSLSSLPAGKCNQPPIARSVEKNGEGDARDEQNSTSSPSSDRPQGNPTFLDEPSYSGCSVFSRGSAAGGSGPELGDWQMVQIPEGQSGCTVLRHFRLSPCRGPPGEWFVRGTD